MKSILLFIPILAHLSVRQVSDSVSSGFSLMILGSYTTIGALLDLVVDILTGGAMIAAVGGVIYGAILYTTAGGSSDRTKKGMEVIRNTIIGIILFAVFRGILSFLGVG